MDWKLLLIGAVMVVLGALLAWRYRGTKFGTETGPGCAMALAVMLVLTGVTTLVVAFLFRV